jgi:hypothetical protein
LNAFIAEGIREAEKGKHRATGGRKANGTRHGVGRATANTQYKICNKGNTKCTGGSTNDGAAVQAITYSSPDTQKWHITPL